MADWRQIQARIRKAKTSSDPPSQLGELYERTRDAMVAFELAQWHEKAGHADETVQWYTTAAQRFRRPQWRTKAAEALTRLGAPIPEPIQPLEKERPSDGAAPAGSAAGPGDNGSAASAPQSAEENAEISGSEEEEAGDGEETMTTTESGADSTAPGQSNGAPGVNKRRRRGRRGGRKRRGHPVAGPQQAGGDAFQRPQAAAPVSEAPPRFTERPPSEVVAVRERAAEPQEAPSGMVGSNWQGGAAGRSRAGDPGLSSRISQLESQIRRLLACPQVSPTDPDRAPAGPGVLLLSDSDQVTHYYVEACQTLRIGIGNLLRGGRSARGGAQLKPALAEHLGINEARVSAYLKDHCVVRWIQLDDGAASLAHFATAVLRPVVSE